MVLVSSSSFVNGTGGCVAVEAVFALHAVGVMCWLLSLLLLMLNNLVDFLYLVNACTNCSNRHKATAILLASHGPKPVEADTPPTDDGMGERGGTSPSVA